MSEALVMFHGSCDDGWTAAWIARKVFPDAYFFAASYGEPPPDVKDKEVFILDFSYKRDQLLELKRLATNLTVIDHHKTAAEDLAGLDFCIFDMSKSGARLTWDYFFPKVEIPWLVLYTEDRDLWKWKLPNSKSVSANISSHPKDFTTWDKLEKSYTMDDLTKADCPYVQEGNAILRYKERQVERIISNAREVTLDGHKVFACNSPVEASEVAGRLAEDKPFGIVWCMTEEGKYVYSLRVNNSDVDVSEIAKKYGGGGHASSAAFLTAKFLFD